MVKGIYLVYCRFLFYLLNALHQQDAKVDGQKKDVFLEPLEFTPAVEALPSAAAAAAAAAAVAAEAAAADGGDAELLSERGSERGGNSGGSEGGSEGSSPIPTVANHDSPISDIPSLDVDNSSEAPNTPPHQFPPDDLGSILMEDSADGDEPKEADQEQVLVRCLRRRTGLAVVVGFRWTICILKLRIFFNYFFLFRSALVKL